MSAETISKTEKPVKEKKETQFRMVMKQLTANHLAVAGGIVFLLLCLISLLAPILAPYDWKAVDTANKFLRPSAEHIFGTDQFGRDIFSRVLYGGRWSLTLGLGATIVSNFFGIIVGSIAGYFGGKVDTFIMRFIEIVQCIPGILLTIVISLVLGSGFFNTILALSFGGIWGCARMLRGQILMVRRSEYVEAAKATNVSNFLIIMRYVLPNSIQQTILSACMGIGGTIMGASGLSFLGLGVQPPYPEWGALLSDGRAYIRYYPAMVIAPCIFIALTILAVSLFGDGLRDAMDPRMKE